MTDRILERFVVIKERLSSTAHNQAGGSSNLARCGDALCYSGEKVPHRRVQAEIPALTHIAITGYHSMSEVSDASHCWVVYT